MASSNRHWPSLFKSKSSYTTHQDHQCQSNRSSAYSSGCEERTPEPKPRWNPKPEQIRILESIFNSGLVNPPRDEIRRIRTRLQEYGQVGDANVFYWFQNRKSRSKQKNRQLQKQPQREYAAAAKAVTTSSSSSSDKSSSKSIELFLNCPPVRVDQQPQQYFSGGGSSGNNGSTSRHPHYGEFFQEPFFFPVAQPKVPVTTAANFTQGFCFSQLGSLFNQENQHRNNDPISSNSGVLLTDLMMNQQYGIPIKNSTNKEVEEENLMKLLSRSTLPPPAVAAPLAAPAVITPPAPVTTIGTSTFSNLHGVVEAGTEKLIVFINDVPFEVASGPLNVKEAFGVDAVLVDSSGQAVLTNEWGLTLQSLEHGACYYLVRSLAYDHAGSVDLI